MIERGEMWIIAIILAKKYAQIRLLRHFFNESHVEPFLRKAV